jgi:bifunctional non-homologous end joining protein LigD
MSIGSMVDPYPGARMRITPLAPPMQARETGTLPRGEDWIYEFWWGGERIRGIKQADGVRIISREGRDMTNRFPRIAAYVAKLRANNVIIDGEILYLDSYSEAARRFLAGAADDPLNGGLVLLAYDLLCDERRDVRQYSLLCRRLLLASIVQGTPMILSPLIHGGSETALGSAARLGFRGVVAKRAGSPYRPNSVSTDWLKMTFSTKPAADAGGQPTHSPFFANGAASDLAGAAAAVG